MVGGCPVLDITLFGNGAFDGDLSTQQAQAHADKVAGLSHRLVHFPTTQMRNPRADSQRRTEANARRTAERIDEYLTIKALRETWDKAPMATQCRNHAYILRLRARERNVRNYLAHRAGPDADL